MLAGFINLCGLFRNFNHALDGDGTLRTRDSFSELHEHLRVLPKPAGCSSDLQQADFILTQQWMRIVLWKTSMHHVRLTGDREDDSLSLIFPDQVARTVVNNLNVFPIRVVEAHGLGMVRVAFVWLSTQPNTDMPRP